MTITELEAEIKRVGSLMATAQLQYAESGCFADAGRVGAYELQMRKLANAREAKAVAQ